MADAAVETGHELVLATLLVHFDVDELEQLPMPLRRAVQDVYDIASDLAATKLACQREARQLRDEVARLRAECATCAAQQPTFVLPSASPATNRTPPDPGIADRTRTQSDPSRDSVRPRWCNSTRIAPRSHIAAHRAQHESASISRPDTSAYRRWASAPCLKVNRRQGPRACPSSSYYQQAPMVPTVDTPSGLAASSDMNIRVMTLPTADDPTITHVGDVPSSTRRTNISLRKPLPPSNKVEAPIPVEVSGCIKMQVESARHLQMVKRKLGQVALWKPTHQSSRFVVLVPHADGAMAQARVHSLEEIHAALQQLRVEVIDLQETLGKSSRHVLHTSAWIARLKERHAILESMANDINKWINHLTTVVEKFSRHCFSPVVPPENTHGLSLVWNEVNSTGTTSVSDDTWHLPTDPGPTTHIFVPYAVSSFLVRALEVYVVTFIAGFDFDALKEVGVAARELEFIFDMFHEAKSSHGEQSTRADEYAVTFVRRHAKALRAIQERAAGCSEEICGVKLSRPACMYSLSTFPADRYNWEVFEDIQVGIVSCHVTLTRLHEVPESDHAIGKQTIAARLSAFEEAIATWTDTRFSVSTEARTFERRQYMKLAMWCHRLHEIIACHGKSTP